MAPSSQVVKKLVPLEPQPEPGPEPGQGNELQSWQWLVFSLCFYGFMAQMRPGESFTTPYLLGPKKNFTKEQARGLSAGRTGLWTQRIVGRCGPLDRKAAAAVEVRRPCGVRGPVPSPFGGTKGVRGCWGSLREEYQGLRVCPPAWHLLPAETQQLFV